MAVLKACGVSARITVLLAFALASSAVAQRVPVPDDGSVLPFPPTPSASVAAPTLQQSKMQRRVEKRHLPQDAPNILIILLDDVGFGLPDTYGGPIHTPTLSRIAGTGISYNTLASCWRNTRSLTPSRSRSKH
jgi:arylsulfatase